MIRLVPIVLIAAALLGCTTIPQDSPQQTDGSVIAVPDIEGHWSMVFHLEVVDFLQIPMSMFIREIICDSLKCRLEGYVESTEFGKPIRYGMKSSVYYPEPEIIYIAFEYGNEHIFASRVEVVFDQFLGGGAPMNAMGGHHVTYGKTSLSNFWNSEDASILAEMQEGKVVRAGHVTAWPK